MNVEVICIGTELLLGEVLDTNSQYLAQVIAECGLAHYYRSVVGDNEQRLYAAFATAFDRGADVVIAAGGLGPTVDDVTKQVAADYFGQSLSEDLTQRALIAKKYTQVAEQTIPESVFKQALFPVNCQIFPNDNGTAPGCLLTRGEQHIILLPGPPKELRLMVERYVKPVLQSWQTTQLFSHVFHCFDLGESVMEARIADLLATADPVTIAPYAGEGTSRLRLSVQAVNEQEAARLFAPLQRVIRERIGAFIYSENEETLPEKMARQLAGKRIGVIDLTEQAQFFWQFQPTPLAPIFCEQLQADSWQGLFEQLQVRTESEVVVKTATHFKLDSVCVFTSVSEQPNAYAYHVQTYDATGALCWERQLPALVPYSHQAGRTVTKIAGYFWQASNKSQR